MTSFDFSFFSFYFLVVQKSWIFSHPVQYSTSPKYPCFPELLYSTYIVCMLWREERCPCSSSSVVAKKNVWSGRRISRRAIHNYFLFLLSSFFVQQENLEDPCVASVNVVLGPGVHRLDSPWWGSQLPCWSFSMSFHAILFVTSFIL